jgi:hypothetical protein
MVKDRNGEPERGEWMGADRGSNKMNTASNTRLRLSYPSWSRPRSHWSATDPQNQQTTFQAKTHQHTAETCKACCLCYTGQTGDAGQNGGKSRSDRWLQQPHNKCFREPQRLL